MKNVNECTPVMRNAAPERDMNRSCDTVTREQPSRNPITDVVGLTATSVSRAVRASNDDRRRVMDLLQAHYVTGRLDAAELEQRIEGALAAKTLADLDALLADLPQTVATGGSQSSVDEPFRRRRRHGKRRHGAEVGFGAHAASYLLVITMLVTIWLLTTPGGYFWPVWPMLGWGIGLASHGLAVLGLRTRGAGRHELGRERLVA
jgi:hypothetical protein